MRSCVGSPTFSRAAQASPDARGLSALVAALLLLETFGMVLR
jgi:hypothetical protein